MIVKVQSPIADPSAMWLVYAEGKAFSTVLHKGSVPAAVQEAVIKGAGKAYFNVTVTANKITAWAAQATGQTW